MGKDQLPVKSTVVKQDKKQEAESTTVAQLGSIEVQIVAVNVPYVTTPTSGFQCKEENRRCDLGQLSAEQARKLRAIRRGYDYSGTKLANGGEIKSLADAVRAWLDSVEI